MLSEAIQSVVRNLCCFGSADTVHSTPTKHSSRLSQNRKSPSHLRPKPEVAVSPLNHSGQVIKSRRDRGDELNDISVSHLNCLPTKPNERIVDGPPSSPRVHIRALESRIRELEATIGQSSFSPTASKHGRSRDRDRNQERDSTTVLSAEFAKEIMSREVELERLRTENSFLREQKQQHEEKRKELQAEIAHNKKEWSSTAEELRRVLAKQTQLEAEYSRISKDVGAGAQEAVDKLKHLLNEREAELREMLRERQAKEDAHQEELSRMKSSIRYLELQNEDLLRHSKNQEDRLFQMKNAPKSSSASTRDGDSDGRSSDGKIKPHRLYTKANSNLGVTANIGTPTFVNNLRRSFSNIALDTTRSTEVTKTMSQIVRNDYSLSSENRSLARNLRNVLRQYVEGEELNLADLAFLDTRYARSSSDSDFEIEHDSDSTPMTIGRAEKLLKHQDRNLQEVAKDLNAVRLLVTEVIGRARGNSDSTYTDDVFR